MRQLFLDTETTGLEVHEGHRIIEIGVVELVNGNFTGNNFWRYLNPHREIHRGAVAVHGITNQFLDGKPEFHEIASEFLNFVRGAELLIHNAPFDTSFLNAELLRVGSDSLDKFCPSIVDTVPIARMLHPGQKVNLDALCKHYKVDNRASKFHGALLDAQRLAMVYLAGFADMRVDLSKPMLSDASVWIPNVEKELFAHLRKNPLALYELSPRKFEELIAAIFRNNGFSVELTPQTRDGGLDIIAVQHSKLTGNTVNLIECKRYSPANKVGIGVVQRLLGAVTQNRATKGIVVTTSSFTQDAIRVAEETRHIITLNNYNAIVDWIGNLKI